MASLTNLLKKSVKVAKNGEGFKQLTPTDLPPGVKTRPDGSFILPDDLAQCADILHRTTKDRLALDRRSKRLQELETALEDKFVNELPASSRGISGLVAHAKIVPKDIPIVDGEAGWVKLYKYIAQKKAWELLQRRLGQEAAQEIIDAGEGAKAGLTVFHKKKVSVTKI